MRAVFGVAQAESGSHLASQRGSEVGLLEYMRGEGVKEAEYAAVRNANMTSSGLNLQGEQRNQPRSPPRLRRTCAHTHTNTHTFMLVLVKFHTRPLFRLRLPSGGFRS